MRPRLPSRRTGRSVIVFLALAATLLGSATAAQATDRTVLGELFSADN